jgi:hypothetical protein
VVVFAGGAGSRNPSQAAPISKAAEPS